jgi:hypothetical protein
MKNYLNLNLTNEPLNDKEAILAKYSHEQKGYSLESTSIFKNEVIEYFCSKNLIPDFAVVFSAKIRGEQENRFIHSDLVYDTSTNSWNHVPCGVNWDIQGVGTFQWWNIPDTVMRCYPGPPTDNSAYSKFSGIHFEARRKAGIPAGSTLIESTSTDRPLLVRTDIPHSVIYTVPRTCVSLRFKNTTGKDWSEIYNSFDKILVECDGIEPLDSHPA